MADERNVETRIAVLEERIRALTERHDECVTKDQFLPVRIIVYGLASAVGATVVAAILRRVVVGA